MQGRPSITKRQKEQARQERAKQKAERRAHRSEEKRVKPAGAEEEDPDIAGIVPGPQPLPWEGEESQEQ
jgi:hypothetical protein